MKKLAITALILISLNTVYAADTIIVSYTANPVQCNKMGWVYNNTQTAWENDCAPLEVQSADGSKIFAVENTATNQCRVDQIAIYNFNEGDSDIHFQGCL